MFQSHRDISSRWQTTYSKLKDWREKSASTRVLWPLREYAISMLGTQYFWGGDDPISGFDCSGLVCEILRAGGVVPWNYRSSSQGLFDRFSSERIENPRLGALAFFGRDEKSIVHVGFCIDSIYMVEAGGGDESVLTNELASQKNAFVRLRPNRYRRDFLCFVWPPYIDT